MQVGPSDHCLVRNAAHGHHLGKVHFGEERCTCGPAKSHRSGPSHETSVFLWVFDDICREYGCLLVNLLVTRVNANLPISMSPIPDSWHGKRMLFST